MILALLLEEVIDPEELENETDTELADPVVLSELWEVLVLDRLEGVELDGVDELDVPLTDELKPRDEELDRLEDEDRLLSELEDSELLDDLELDLELLLELEDLLDELSEELLELDRLDCEYGLLDVLELLEPVVELTVFDELVLESSTIDDEEDGLDSDDELSWLWLEMLSVLDEIDELPDELERVLDDSDVSVDDELIEVEETLLLLDSLLELDRLVPLWLLDELLKSRELELDMLVCEDSLSSVLELLCDNDESELELE